jgi:CAAX protease family protein
LTQHLDHPTTSTTYPDAQTLSTRAIISILTVTVGWFAVSSLLGLLHYSGGRYTGFYITTTNARLIALLVFEVVVGIALVAFLRSRGWRLQQLSLPPAWFDLLRGVGLWLLMIVGVALLVVSAQMIARGHSYPMQPTRFYGRIDWGVVAGTSLINPVFEEFLFLGFVGRAFRGAGAWRIGALSVGMRVLVHTYQGLLALLAVAPVGVIFVWYYLRTKRLWPVIVAHAIQDAIALSWIAATGGR